MILVYLFFFSNWFEDVGRQWSVEVKDGWNSAPGLCRKYLMRFNASHHCHGLSRHLSGNFLYRLLQWARTSGVKSSWCTSSWWIHWGWNQNLHSKDWIGKAGNSRKDQKTGSAMMVQGQHRFFFGSWNMVLKLAKYIGSIRICQVHQVDTLFFPSFFESSRSRGPYVLNI